MNSNDSIERQPSVATASWIDGFRYSIMVLVLFPLSFCAVERGGVAGLLFVAGVMLLHVLLDNLTPPLTEPREAFSRAHDLWLNLQLPAALMLIAILVGKSADPESLARFGIHGVQRYPSALDFGAIVACAFMFGGNTVVAHEFMHRRGRLQRLAAWLLLTVTGDSQFVIAHLYGHHVNVGTAADSATARRGESLYRFFLRSTAGQYRESLRFEQRRLRLDGHGAAFWRNRVALGGGLSLSLVVLVGLLFGVRSGLSVVAVMGTSKLLLEAINYIQHYGLVRVPGSQIQPRHSWDCAGRGAGRILFGLSLHADHHAHPTKPMWNLKPSSGAPVLKHGYMFTLVVAFVPWLWFRYISAAVANWDQTMGSKEELAQLGNTR
jgi:alkane 1-monooxygenase